MDTENIETIAKDLMWRLALKFNGQGAIPDAESKCDGGNVPGTSNPALLSWSNCKGKHGEVVVKKNIHLAEGKLLYYLSKNQVNTNYKKTYLQSWNSNNWRPSPTLDLSNWSDSGSG